MDIPMVNGHYDLNWMLENIIKYEPHEKSKWGPKMWTMLSIIVSYIPCSACAKHGVAMLDFEHDVVNIHTGKKIHDVKKFKEYYNNIYKMVQQYDMNTGMPLSSCVGDECNHKVVAEMR